MSAHHPNSVLLLRQRQLAAATRPFLARGSKVVRCEHCLLAQKDCICAERPQVDGRSAFCFLMYHGESRKPSNTGRLVADVVRDNHAFLWDRTQPDPQLLALLQDARYAPMLVFPHEYAEPSRCINSPREVLCFQSGQDGQDGKIPLFVMLDGTWREAKKMFRNSPYLAALPVLGIQPAQLSSYLMRDAAHRHQLCTAEVAIEVLRLAEENAVADALAGYFAVFCRSYLTVRPQLLEKDRAAGQTGLAHSPS